MKITGYLTEQRPQVDKLQSMYSVSLVYLLQRILSIAEHTISQPHKIKSLQPKHLTKSYYLYKLVFT